MINPVQFDQLPPDEHSGKILCVDDEVNILKSLRRFGQSEQLAIEVESDPDKALKRLQQQEFAVILCDMRMPAMTGAQFLEQAAQLQPDAYRILLTGYTDLPSMVAAVNFGKIQRFVAKPWDNQQLLQVLQAGLEHSRLLKKNNWLQQQVATQNQQLRQLNQQLEHKVDVRTTQLRQTLAQLQTSHQQVADANRQLMKVLYNQMNVNPLIDGSFALNVSYLCRQLARRMQLTAEQQEHLALAGKLCEMGLPGLPYSLLTKPYYQLDAHELSRYREHIKFARLILSPAQAMAPVADIISAQYEHFNGSGEPEQKHGEDIPVGARILAVARDYYAALSGRTYETKCSAETALARLRAQQGTHYDPQVLMALAQIADQLSTGVLQTRTEQGLTLQQLQSGMRLKHHIYNDHNMLLLPEGTILNTTLIQRLRKILAGTTTELLFQVDPETQHHQQES